MVLGGMLEDIGVFRNVLVDLFIILVEWNIFFVEFVELDGYESELC